MVNVEAAQAVTRMHIRAAVAIILGAWCLPALASSGIEILCPDTKSVLDDPLDAAVTSLAAHTESALEDILDDDAIAVPTLAETSANNVKDAGDTESADEPAESGISAPTVTTRLPSVSETTLPSFRRQMHRTDI